MSRDRTKKRSRSRNSAKKRIIKGQRQTWRLLHRPRPEGLARCCVCYVGVNSTVMKCDEMQMDLQAC